MMPARKEADRRRLGKLNRVAVARIIGAKHRRSVGVNRRRGFAGGLVSDLAASGAAVDLNELVREPLLPAFGSRT
jgi:hypothetical protein